MYTSFYNLKETPFSQSVDPKYTWLNEKQLEALADFKQNYLDKKGFFLITGDAGTGKTAFTKRLLAEIESKTIVATVTDPDLEKLDFFNWLSLEFDMNVMFKSKGAFLTRFKGFLLAADQKNINVNLIIDDAHRINQDLIEEILTLSNIEKAGSKLMSIFFVGQSGFNKILQEKQNSALKQSINAHFHLKPLKEDEIVQLISYRLKVAGTEAEIFSSRAYHEIYQFSAGYPRMVVNVCDRAMMAGCVSATHVIDKDLIIKCGKDLQIGGIKREIEGIDYLNDIPGSKGPATIEFNEKYKEIKKTLLSDLKIRIGPAARTAILPAFLAILVIVGIYFIYQFKSSLLSWANSNLDQEKSTSVQSEPSALNITQKKGNESEINKLLSVNEDEKSIQTEGKRAELSNDGYVLDELKLDEKIILSDNQSPPTADESSVKSSAVDGFSDVDVNSESRQIRSDTEITSPSTSEKKVTEIFPEKTGADIEETPLVLSEIETEKESTDREFKMLSRRLALKLKLSGKERLEADIQEVHLEPKTGRVISAPPANDSKAREDVQPPQSVAKKLYLAEIERQEADIQIVRLEPKIEKIISTDPADDSKSRIDVQPQQSAVEKPQPQAPLIKPDLDPITKTQQAPDTEVAGSGQVNKEDDLRNRLYLRERLESFLEIYCHTYETKDLDHFSTFFAPNAKENDKPFHKLLPKYRRNFEVIEFINYRIELQKFKYDDEHGTINIEGRFFLEWLPGGTQWKRNSGKIFMELKESGTSLKISRLNYYGDQQKKNQIGVD
ncbi:MAG TPA: AAA family ATPase [Balneolales bacterium]|nr:AAA family ATPase [Balneolales bacterium]